MTINDIIIRKRGPKDPSPLDPPAWGIIKKKASNDLEAGKAGFEIFGSLIVVIEPRFEFYA